MFTFTFDHAVSDGERGYGAVAVRQGGYFGDVAYVGRGFARTVLVERYPEAGLTYDQAQRIVAFLSSAPTGQRQVTVCVDDSGKQWHMSIGGDCPATPDGMWCECEPGDIACNYQAASYLASHDPSH